ncbi:MAG TPA: hypothetical protein VIJ79_03750 [Acidobacteriaceae bacterium]
MSESLFNDAADWDLFDVHARLGSSGVHGELALDTAGLLAEMDRFFIRRALVSHWESEEYEAASGNETLARELAADRMTPAWAIMPDATSVAALALRKPAAVRITPGTTQHNFSLAAWSAAEMFDYLQQHSVVTLITLADIGWPGLTSLLENFPRLPVVLLETGYRVDRYLFPLLKRFPLLHFDSATYLAHRQLEGFVEIHGPDRLLFGTRLPLYTPASSLGVLSSSRIPDAARLAIAGGNLRRLLAAASFGGAL